MTDVNGKNWKHLNLRKLSLRSLKKKAWSAFSKFVRLNGAYNNGMNFCFSCGIAVHWKELNAGHFIHNKLDFDEININPQCVRCNKWLSGNLGNYALNLINKYGLEAVEELRLRAKQTTVEKYSRDQFVDLTKKYEKKTQKILKRLNA